MNDITKYIIAFVLSISGILGLVTYYGSVTIPVVWILSPIWISVLGILGVMALFYFFN